MIWSSLVQYHSPSREFVVRRREEAKIDHAMSDGGRRGGLRCHQLSETNPPDSAITAPSPPLLHKRPPILRSTNIGPVSTKSVRSLFSILIPIQLGDPGQIWQIKVPTTDARPVRPLICLPKTPCPCSYQRRLKTIITERTQDIYAQILLSPLWKAELMTVPSLRQEVLISLIYDILNSILAPFTREVQLRSL